jgi:hypothetical protein
MMINPEMTAIPFSPLSLEVWREGVTVQYNNQYSTDLYFYDYSRLV